VRLIAALARFPRRRSPGPARVRRPVTTRWPAPRSAPQRPRRASKARKRANMARPFATLGRQETIFPSWGIHVWFLSVRPKRHGRSGSANAVGQTPVRSAPNASLRHFRQSSRSSALGPGSMPWSAIGTTSLRRSGKGHQLSRPSIGIGRLRSLAWLITSQPRDPQERGSRVRKVPGCAGL
jgi:hypothetical protein